MIGDGHYTALDLPFTSFVSTFSNQIIFIGAAFDRFPAVARYHIASKQVEVLYESAKLLVDKNTLSYLQEIEFLTDNRKTTHAYYYPPYNEDYQAEANESLLMIN